MITLNDIFNNSHPHGLDGGKQTIIKNDKFILSIVGGRSGLYGDFDEDFELAIIDPITKDFITRMVFPELNDDVMAYVNREKLLEVANLLFKKYSFQES